MPTKTRLSKPVVRGGRTGLRPEDYLRLDREDLERLTVELLTTVLSRPEPTEEEMNEADDRFDYLREWSDEVTEAAETLEWKRRLMGLPV